MAVTLALCRDRVPKDGDLGVAHEALRHDLRRAEFATADEDVDV